MLVPHPSTLIMAERTGRVALSFGARVLDLVLPPRCAACACAVPSQGDLCADCWSGLRFLEPPWCRQCGYPTPEVGAAEPLCASCARKSPAFDRARAAMRYDEASKRLILSFKHHERLDGLNLFGRWMAQVGAELIEPTSLLVPVPLHRWRLLRRGFNQSSLLALAIQRQIGGGLCLDMLVKPMATDSQQTLGGAARARNITTASFAVRQKHAHRVQDAKIVLIDDVMTTGSTVSAVAQVLRRAGAARVDVLSLARVVRSS
ncbi:MAG: ComF family protein [Pseudomonadota bacterium]